MSDEALIDSLEGDFDSVDSVLAGLSRVEELLYARKDRRAVFATAYLTMTREIGRGVGESVYRDPVWVASYAIAFANLYRSALLHFERGDMARVPKPWRISFETSSSGQNLLLQDLLLGVNAHINNDLALALAAVSIDPGRDSRRQDHLAVNDAIRRATDAVQDRVGNLYAPVFRLFDRVTGGFDEKAANFSIAKARLNAWVSAVALVSETGDSERAAVVRSIEDEAAVIARLIRLPARSGFVFTLRRWFERLTVRLELIRPGF